MSAAPISVASATVPTDPADLAADLVELLGPAGARRYIAAIAIELGAIPPRPAEVDIVRLAGVVDLADTLRYSSGAEAARVADDIVRRVERAVSIMLDSAR